MAPRKEKRCEKLDGNKGIQKASEIHESLDGQNRAIVFADLEDLSLLKLRSLDPSCPFFLSDNSIWGQ